jgi:hypothetical protein
VAIDFTTDRGQVRLLTADLDENAPLLTDGQLDGYLALNTGAVLLAAADALDAMATSETLVARKIRTQDLATDGPAVAAELRAQATALRGRWAAENSDFTIVPAGGGTGYEAEEQRQ